MSENLAGSLRVGEQAPKEQNPQVETGNTISPIPETGGSAPKAVKESRPATKTTHVRGS